MRLSDSEPFPGRATQSKVNRKQRKPDSAADTPCPLCVHWLKQPLLIVTRIVRTRTLRRRKAKDKL